MAGCAAMGPPGGGPEDKTPPEVLTIEPAPGSVRVASNARIELQFSEPVEETSVQTALFISPPQERPKINVRGGYATIRLSEGLPQDRPLIVTIGSGVKDLHGNPLMASITFAITTGDSIYGGEIVGRVYSELPIESMLAGAWPVSDTTLVQPDTIPAPYLTQTGKDGTFRIEYLLPGTYRVLAWDDRDGDRKYRAGVDRLALPYRDLVVNEDSSESLSLLAVKRDSAGAAPLILLASDNRHFQLRLTRSAGSKTSNWLRGLALVDSAGDELKIVTSWVDPGDSAKLIFITDPQQPDMKYSGRFEGDTTWFDFIGSGRADSTGPRIVKTFPAANARDLALEATGWIAFDDEVFWNDSTSIFTFTAGDSDTVALEAFKEAPNRIEWKTSDKLSPGDRIRLGIDLSRISDAAGNRAGDSLWVAGYSVSDPGALGEIGGTVSAGTGRRIIVSAKRVGASRSVPKTAPVSPTGDFRIEALEPGEYSLWCWEDREPDGVYTPGELKPFSFAEPFAIHPDTLTVRARWETGGIRLALP